MSYTVTAHVSAISDSGIRGSLSGAAAHRGGERWTNGLKEQLTSASDDRELIAGQSGEDCVGSGVRPDAAGTWAHK